MTIEVTDESASIPTPSSLALIRAVIGLAQGLVLYLLYRAQETHTWPATDGMVFAPILLVSVFVPLLILAGLNSLRLRTLIFWTLLATITLAGLALHDIVRELYQAHGSTLRIVPSPTLLWFTAAALFIAHALVTAGDADRKIIASYPRYFDVSWMHGVQIALGLTFLGLFWALLFLGAALFELIQIKSLTETIRRPWFYVPATTLVFAISIHVTDVRADLVRGARTLTLTLLSWLMPLMAALAAAFLLSLFFTGLEPLWNTRRATYLLLAAAAALILLINAAYQDGTRDTASVLRYTGYLAAAALVPLVALSAYGVAIRINQYGWTPDRVIAVACIAVTACYAAGYAVTALASRPWLRWLEATNVFAAFVILAVLLALFSPIADPARISVADQLRRLESGQTPPNKFDFRFLRFDAGRYGREALEKLAGNREGPHAADIAQRAEQALRMRNRIALPEPLSPAARASNITVFPHGQVLPGSFLSQDWSTTAARGPLPACLTGLTAFAWCEAVMVDVDGDGQSEVLLFPVPTGVAVAFTFKNSRWESLGVVTNQHCPGVREAIRTGHLQPLEPVFKDIDAGGQRLRISVGCK